MKKKTLPTKPMKHLWNTGPQPIYGVFIMKKTVTLEEHEWELLFDVLGTVQLNKIEEILYDAGMIFEQWVHIYHTIRAAKEGNNKPSPAKPIRRGGV